jgi:hypothetical protein
MHVPARLSTLTNADLLRLVSRVGAVDNSYPALRLLPHDTNVYVSQVPLAAHPPSLRTPWRLLRARPPFPVPRPQHTLASSPFFEID